jgi:hypothetical protein
MLEDDADELVEFQRVRVVGSTAPALFCAIGGKRVWLPREHIKGNLWCRGDRGTLRIRRWVALDRHLVVPNPMDGVPPAELPRLRPNQPGRLRVLRRLREVPLGH